MQNECERIVGVLQKYDPIKDYEKQISILRGNATDQQNDKDESSDHESSEEDNSEDKASILGDFIEQY